MVKRSAGVDTIAAFRHANDDQIVMTIRGIGEMRPNNPATLVKLAGETDEFGIPRAFVSINPGPEDRILWNAMDTAADQVALIFANGQPYEVLSGAAFQPVAADQPASQCWHFRTVAMALAPRTMRRAHWPWATTPIRRSPMPTRAFTACPICMRPGRRFSRRSARRTRCSPVPRWRDGSPTTLRRRSCQAGFTALFDGASLQGWRMSTIRNQPGRNDPGHFVVTNGALVAVPGTDIGLLWHTQPTPPNFLLKLEWRRWQDDAELWRVCALSRPGGPEL